MFGEKAGDALLPRRRDGTLLVVDFRLGPPEVLGRLDRRQPVRAQTVEARLAGPDPDRKALGGEVPGDDATK